MFRRLGCTVLFGTLLVGFGPVLSGCDSDLNTSDPQDQVQPGTAIPLDSFGQASNSALSLQVGTGSIRLLEGADTLSVPVSVNRLDGSATDLQLFVTGQDEADERYLRAGFENGDLGSTGTATSLQLQLAIGPRPIQPQTRTLLLTAAAGAEAVLTAIVTIGIEPTNRPDVYVLAGQSNMMGFSEKDSRQTAPGAADAPDPRIRQLNVTGNDEGNFKSPADFSDPESVYNSGMPFSIALDPLHDGYDNSNNGKAGTRIGPGLSFAKRALEDTTADIILVPTAWSDTGFCKRNNNRFAEIGWNTTPENNPALSGPLLFQRAVLRTNIALEQSGGVLRGILWHQGEADSDDAACADIYAGNLAELVTALRSSINTDARGAIARGADADIPFILATMSMGENDSGAQAPFDDLKQQVDNAHRTIGSLVPLADYVNGDDLIPPAYPCGDGSCIHFGAAAYREMGIRYYERLIGLLQ